MTVHLTVVDLLRLTRILGAGPVREVGLLNSAASRARASVFGEDAYPTIPEKAAALLHSVASNHALVDGNKRLAWLATAVFLDLNEWEIDLTEDGAFALVMDVASGSAAVSDITDRLRVHRRV